ncbi:MAG TPA: beta-propeller fold lactonase family protein [Acidobacteriaceae bacterium]|nr:beta-propeller fold lactonase family protein [Acidobacteriaceae bacterium]
MVSILLLGPLFALTGCDFFVAQNNNPPAATAGDFIYVANGGNTFIAGYTVGSNGSLSIVPNSPVNNGVAGLCLAISPANTFLFVGTTNGIYEYAINSDGSLSIGNGGSPVAQDVIATALQVDSTGGYLLAAGLASATQAQGIGIYQINTSNGVLSALGGSPLGLYTGPAASPTVLTPTGLLITPDNAKVYVSLGTLGVQVLTLGPGGALSAGNGATILPPYGKSAGPSDYGLASDPNTKFLFVGEINTGLRVLSIGTNGSLTEVAGSPYTTGAGPVGVTVDSTGAYVYVANKGSSNINAFALNASSGQLTSISGSPFGSGGQLPTAMVNDNTGKYLAVMNSGSNGLNGNNDLQLFSFSASTPGALKAAASATTGTDPTSPQAIAATFPAAK